MASRMPKRGSWLNPTISAFRKNGGTLVHGTDAVHFRIQSGYRRKDMRKLVCLTGLFLLAGVLSAGEKKLMHCFTFTVIEEATEADWQAFYKATDELPGKIPGLNKVWYGKLRRPLRVGEATRQFGVCMELDDEAALKVYADHPAHTDWVKVYSKVRVPRTTTFDILGQ